MTEQGAQRTSGAPAPASEGTGLAPFRTDLQGLRALAVLAVIADHLFGWPSGGFVGVDVFFVVSGFLVTGLLLREHATTGRISWADFSRRRIRRIVPAATVVLVGTVTASFLLLRSARAESVAADGVWAFFFASNWHAAATGTDYLRADGPVSPLQHFWSLAVEEQFYLGWPLVLIAVAVIVRRRPGGRRRLPGATAAVAAVIALMSLGWAAAETSISPAWAYFSTLSRAWELAVGACLACAAPALSRLPGAVRPVLSHLGLAGIVAACLLVTPASSFPWPWAVLPVVATASCIAAFVGAPPRSVWVLTNPVSVSVGTVSYSLYLWHFPVIILLGTVLPEGGTFFAVAVALMVVLSVASYSFVEAPVRRSAWLEPGRHGVNRAGRGLGPSRRVRPMAAVGMTALVTATIVLVVSAVQLGSAGAEVSVGSGPPAESTTDSADLFAHTDPASLERLQNDLSNQITAALDADDWPVLTPTLDEVMDAGFPGDDWNGCAPALPDGRACEFRDLDPRKLVLVAGDSIAVAWLPALRAAVEPAGWSVRALTYPGCPFTDAIPDKAGERTAACPGIRAQAEATIRELRPAVLVLSNNHGYALQGQPPGIGGAMYWDQRFRSAAERVIPAAGVTVLLGQPPRGGDPAECATAFSSPADCVTTVTDGWRRFDRLDRRAAADLGMVHVDPHRWFCTGDRGCPAFVDGVPVRRDTTHMTPAYAATIAPVLRAALHGAGVF